MCVFVCLCVCVPVWTGSCVPVPVSCDRACKWACTFDHLPSKPCRLRTSGSWLVIPPPTLPCRGPLRFNAFMSQASQKRLRVNDDRFSVESYRSSCHICKSDQYSQRDIRITKPLIYQQAIKPHREFPVSHHQSCQNGFWKASSTSKGSDHPLVFAFHYYSWFRGEMIVMWTFRFERKLHALSYANVHFARQKILVNSFMQSMTKNQMTLVFEGLS